MKPTAQFQTESEVSGPTSVTPRLRLDAEYPSAHAVGFSSRVGRERVLAVELCGDYDNDGFLDLFVTRQLGQGNVLYHNNGDGTFARVSEGSIVNDRGNSVGCAWGDYDNDGFLDLFVTNGAFGGENQTNF